VDLRGWVRQASVLAVAGLLSAAAAPGPADPVVALHAGLVRLFAGSGGASEAAIEALAVRTFDMSAITNAVLADAARTATSAERARLSRALLEGLARRIALAARPTAGDGFAVAQTQATGGEWLVTTRQATPRPTTQVWRVRREGARWRIVDNLRDGISTVGVQQDDFAAQLKGRTLDAVIAQMQRRAAAPQPGF
jgi:ABC-type transporter MlaC component